MNNSNTLKPDDDLILARAFRDDLPPDVEAKLRRRFVDLKSAVDDSRQASETSELSWMHGLFRKEILATASALLLIIGSVMHLRGAQSVLAHSIERLKVVSVVSANLNRAAYMDCTIVKPGASGESVSYHIRWKADGDVRIDMVSRDHFQTMWITDGTGLFLSMHEGKRPSMPLQTFVPNAFFNAAMEFKSPALIAQNMEEQYELIQTGARSGSGEFLITGRIDRQMVEVDIDAATYLPRALRKYAQDSYQMNTTSPCLLEARFVWNKPIADSLFIPGALAKTP